MPYGLRYFSSQIIAFFVYFPLARMAFLLEKFNINVSNFPLSSYKNLSFYTMRTDALDRFGTRLEQRFTKDEIKQMMHNAGLENIKFSDSKPFWVAVGFKRDKTLVLKIIFYLFQILLIKDQKKLTLIKNILSSKKMKILILGTVPNDLLNFRSELIKDILKTGNEVIALSSKLDSDSASHMKKLGITYESISLNRHGLSLRGDIKTLSDLLKLFKNRKPNLVLAHGIKLVIWGGISGKNKKNSFFCFDYRTWFCFSRNHIKKKTFNKILFYIELL